MPFDVVSFLIILVLAVVIVMFGPEPAKSKLSEVGGIGFLIWLVIQLVKVLIR